MQKCQWLGVESDMVVWLHSLFGFEYRNTWQQWEESCFLDFGIGQQSCKSLILQADGDTAYSDCWLSAAAILLPESFFHLCMASD